MRDIAARAALTAQYSAVRTASINASYVRLVTAGSAVLFEARTLDAGRSFAVVDVVGIVSGRTGVLGANDL